MDFSHFSQQHVSAKRATFLALIGLVAVCCVILTYSSAPSTQTFLLDTDSLNESYFKMHLEKFGKSYSSSEYEARLRIFNDNMGYIRKVNSMNKDWYLTPNQFTDLSNEEFRKIYLPKKMFPEINESIESESNLQYPTSVNWVTAGAVTPVKNQGQCGSCWSFSTTGAVEGAWKLAGHSLTSLSEQQLVSCNTQNHGCSGGWPAVAMQYIINNKGITTESNYPYTAKNGVCNKAAAAQVAATISSYKQVASNNVAALATAVAQQPVSVLVDAGGADWQSYGGGVVTDSNCGTSLDHAVLAAGYNMGSSPAYWLVKNSWGAGWGEAGYIRLAVVAGNGICGVQMSCYYPVV